MLRLHLWEVRALFIPFIHWPDKRVNICVSATHIEFLLCPSHDINTCLWNCPLTCKKNPSCLSPVCLQMTTARVRVTLMTGSKVSDHSVHLEGLGATFLSALNFLLELFFLSLVQEIPSFVFNKWPCVTGQTTELELKHLPYARIISRPYNIHHMSRFNDRNECY